MIASIIGGAFALVIIFLPFIGSILYCFIGRRKGQAAI